MGTARGIAESYDEGQMVVTQRDQRLVEGTLTHLRVGNKIAATHRDLGLLLLQLEPDSIAQAVQKLKAMDVVGDELAQYEKTVSEQLQEIRQDPQVEVPVLDLLLKGLRQFYRYQYPNWAGPRIGKNHGISEINRLSNGPEIGPGQIGDPKPTKTGLADRPGLTTQAPPAESAGRGVRVGQLDGPIRPHHWLAGAYNALPGDLVLPVSPGKTYVVTQGHAMSVASCILEQAAGSRIHLWRILDANGTGDVWTLATQMAELANFGYDVVNISAGQCFCDDGYPPLALDTAVRLLSARSVIVAAAGNHGEVDKKVPSVPGVSPNSVYYPAGCDGVIAVGALDLEGNVATFTPKRAPYIRLMAPGAGITAAYLDGTVTIRHDDPSASKQVEDPSACHPGEDPSICKPVDFEGWAMVTGTSYSAAIVTGAIASRVRPGQVSAWQALDELLNAQAPVPVPNPGGGIIRPYDIVSDG